MNNDAKEAVHSLLSLAPTPPQVIPQKRKQSAVATPTIPPQTPDDVSNESIRCICGIDLDDGFSIACDDCGRWCHAACFDVDQLSVPEEWRCWECVPRVVDREKAVKIQRARQKQVEELKDVEKVRRKQSPGVERKSRKQSAPTVDGGGTSRRKRRPSMVQTPLNNHNHNLNLNGNHNEDEHVDIDEPWTQSYVHINEDNVPLKDTRDKLRQQAQHWRGVTAVAGQSPYEAIPILLPPNHPVPPTTIQQLPPHGVNHPALSLYTNHSVRPPSFSFHTAAPVPSDHYITPFTSTITPTSAYLADPLNSYAHLGMPKPFVHLVGPPLDVALDARLSGNKSRFVRSGCKPNAVLRPVLCPRPNSPLLDANGDRSKETLSFGVFALRDLKANEEVVLGWEWDDGNAVHSLPALIETPHMFPGSQLKYLRQQMSNILHALSSTFTTCACGSRAKDCVLTQMAAFVDGDGPVAGPSTINGRVDLGPLVGAKRGFKTRERVPFSGGLAGMEMCEENEPSSSDHGENSRRILKSAKAKGKERAIDDEQRLDAYIKFPSQRRITIDTTRSPRRPRPPDFGDEMDVDGQDMEERMPPKMRKRWIQREVEVLRVASTSSVASPDSVLTPESSGDGAAGRDDDDRTETDDDHDMPPPPMPAALDPTTVSSIISRRSLHRSTSPPNTHRIPSGPLQAPHATSPSLSFSNLSLLSPIVAHPSSPQPLLAAVDSSTRNLFPVSMQPLKSPPSPTPLLPGTHIGACNQPSSPKDGYFASRPGPTQDTTGSPAPPESATSSAATPPPLTPGLSHSPPPTPVLDNQGDVSSNQPPQATEIGIGEQPTPTLSVSEHHSPLPAKLDEDVEMAPPSTPPHPSLSLSNDEEVSLMDGEAPQPAVEHVDVSMEDGDVPVLRLASHSPHRSPTPVPAPSPAQPTSSPLSENVEIPVDAMEPPPLSHAPPSEASSTPEPTSSPFTTTNELAPHHAPERHPSPAVAPQAPAAKVRMSLKDFSMRKKRQKEEEMAKAAASGVPACGVDVAETPGLVEETKEESKDVQVIARPSTPLEQNKGLNGGITTGGSRASGGGFSLAMLLNSPTEAFSAPLRESGSSSGQGLESAGRAPIVQLGAMDVDLKVQVQPNTSSFPAVHPMSPPRLSTFQSNQVNGHSLSNILTSSPSISVNGHRPHPPPITHDAKVELIDAQIPKEPTPKPRSVDLVVNGASTKSSSYAMLMQSPPIPPSSNSSLPPSALPSRASSQNSFRDHLRRTSHEEGEIQNLNEETPPPRDYPPRTTPTPGPMASTSSYVPRSHTPPTQPRSFLSSRTSTTPSPSGSGLPTRRPSLPFRLGMVPPYPSTSSASSPPPTPLSNAPPSGPASRPLPNAPRALRNGSAGYANAPAGHRPPPRGPLAERDRVDWERERWPAITPRSRARGGGAPGWGR